MALVCTPQALESAASCLHCLTPRQQLEVQTYLLFLIAGQATTTANITAVVAKASCLHCLTDKELMAVQAYLTCIAAGGS
jgi:hypothetical protein